MMRCSIPDLPEDIWRHIHSLLPLRDAARAACLSRALLHSWRCHPNLTLSRDMLIGSKAHACDGNFSDIIDRILRNHSGCLKVLKLDLDGISCRYLDSWLAIAVTPGIEELILIPFRCKYSLPCSFLSNGVRNSIRYLELGFCTFRPTAELGHLRSLTSLHLRTVRIRGDELECVLSNSLALEQLVLTDCKEIICLNISELQQLSYLKVFGCWRLRVIESKAPNISSFFLTGNIPKVSLGETLQMKNLTLYRSNVVCYARAELSCAMPNLETLVLRSGEEVVNTPMLPSKFLYLKHLSIHLTSGLSFSPSYDYFSLVSFLDASPSLETLILDVSQDRMEHESVFGDSSQFRQMTEHRHRCLKSVKISGFSSAKSLVELTCYILNNAVSLECLSLNTVYGFRCSDKGYKGCHPISQGILEEAPRAAMAIRTYIEDKVPSTVKLTVLGPCSECHGNGRPDGLHNKV